jgi:hypothetical protein
MINVVEMVPPRDINHRNQLNESQQMWSLRSIMINEGQIISVVPCSELVMLMSKGRVPQGLHEEQQFSKISFSNGKEIVIVGSPESVKQKAKKMLHG